MITAFALLCQRCGLSHREAADFLEVRLDTIKSWSSGRNGTPPGAIEALRDLYATIARAARHAGAQITKAAGEIELGLAVDDREAQSLGWPCVGAHAAVLGLIVAAAPAGAVVTIVPRGGTVATAAAIAAHEKKKRPPQ